MVEVKKETEAGANLNQALKEQKVKEETKTVDPNYKYLAMRYIQCFCIALFIFGMLWNGTEVLKLTVSQFMMVYGGMGIVVTEIMARLFSGKKKTK